MAGATLGTAYVQIVPSAQGIKGSITNVLGPEAESAGTAVGGKIGLFAKKALVAAGIATAVVGVVKGALSEGAKLQQSYFGGLDTLYGEAADAARNYAKQAASAGVSMNEYSEQAVSFGAALKRAYGGDATKAIEAANTAILDMADNSAKMGTDLTSIQYAYQGFAKQNYTMLDNLKLGYGGTKGEMQRLLKDAEALTGKKYNLDNLGDVYEAVHVIQQDLGLTGTAAAEAEGTFTGSFNAMRAAAKNFLGSLAIGEDVSKSLNILIGNATTFVFKNFIPMVTRILKALPGAIVTAVKVGVPQIVTGLTNLLSSAATSLKGAADKFTGAKVAEWLTSTLPKIISAAGSIIGKLGSALVANLPTIVAAIGRIGLAIVTGLGSAIWGKVTQAANGIRDRFMAPIEAMKDKVKGVLDKIKKFFPVNLGKILHFSLPKISVSGGSAPWGIGGKGTKPSFSVTWSKHALGGIISKRMILSQGSTIHEFGEAGREAIVPLDPFWKKMDQIANAAQNGGGDIVINVYGGDKDPVAIAQEVKSILIRETNQRRLAWQ